MNSLTAIFASSFVVALSGVLMPGPLLAAVIAESAGSGAWAGPLICCGHALLEGCFLALLLFGLDGFLRHSAVIAAISLGGGAFLIYSAVRMLLSLKTLEPARGEGSARSPLRLIASGIMVSVTNPYWSIWWLTAGLGLALSARLYGVWGILVFFTGHITADLLWYSFVSRLIAGRRGFLPAGAYKAILLCCALTLAGFGIFFLLRIPLPAAR